MKTAKYIDYIDDPNDSFDQYLEKAKAYDFRCVFADIDTFGHAKEVLKDTDIIIAGAVDFPDGVLGTEEKLEVFRAYEAAGFREIDYVLNQKMLEERDYDGIGEEMSRIAEYCRAHGIMDKVIVEMCKLDGDDGAKQKICEIAKKVSPACLKTSTGRSFGGAKLSDVKLMKEVLGDSVKIKAAGGIRDYETARAFIEAGASILGATAGIAIVKGCSGKE